MTLCTKIWFEVDNVYLQALGFGWMFIAYDKKTETIQSSEE